MKLLTLTSRKLPTTNEARLDLTVNTYIYMLVIDLRRSFFSSLVRLYDTDTSKQYSLSAKAPLTADAKNVDLAARCQGTIW